MPEREKWFSAEAYEPYVGRWSRIVAGEFVEWLDPERSRDWLDVGCGTGALSEAVLEGSDPLSLSGIDPSPAFVAHTQARITDPRAEFTVGDARDIPADPAAFDYVVSGLVLNFVTDRRRALQEMKRVARRGGRIAAYVWDYADGMQMMRRFWEVAADLHPEARSLDEAARFGDICNPDGLAHFWREADLRELEVSAIEIDTVFEDFEDYWRPFLGGQGPAPTFTASLDEEDRAELERELARRLPVDREGRIALRARAWAIQGTCG